MSGKLFLFLSDHVVTTYEWNGGVFGKGNRLELNEAGLKEFATYMERVHGLFQVYLLVDMTEEELHEEIVPRLVGGNRKKMLEKLASRIFRNSPFFYCRFIGKVPGDTKKERALIIGLSDLENITLCLDILAKCNALIVGIWSLPLLSQEIFYKFFLKKGDGILISPTSGGLRQVFLHDGTIKASRLSHLPSRDPDNIMLFIHGEVARLKGYLGSLGIVKQNAVLDVYSLVHYELYEHIESENQTMSTYTIHNLDAEELGVKLGLWSEVEEKNVDFVFAQYLLKYKIGNHYARSQETKAYLLEKMRFWLRTASLLVFGAGLGFGIFASVDGYLASAKLPLLSRQADEAQANLRKIVREDFEKTGGGRDMVEAARIMSRIQNLSARPDTALIQISRVLGKYPKIWVDGINWSSDQKVINIGKGRNSGGRPQLPAAQGGASFLQTLHLSGQVYPFAGDVRKANKEVERFINALRSTKEIVSVISVRMPMDASRDEVLSSNNLSKGATSKFVLSVTMSLEKVKK